MFKLDDVSDHATNGANCRSLAVDGVVTPSFGSRHKWREL